MPGWNQEEREHEDRRPVCGSKCAGRWTQEVRRSGSPVAGREDAPQLCEDFQGQAVTAARQDQALPEQKSGGWLSRLRT
ncbi:hypothetical protein ACWGN9_38650 [Streptomyces sp. NPDC055775]